MAALLVLALLPLDVAPPARQGATDTADGLKLSTVIEDNELVAYLENVSQRRIRIFVGWSCGEAGPFTAVVDRDRRPFAFRAEACTANEPQFETLEPGARRAARSRVRHDGGAHAVASVYRVDLERLALSSRRLDGVWSGELTSMPVHVDPTLEVMLGKVVQAQGGVVSFEIEHLYRGARPLRFLSGWKGPCGAPEDVLLVDGTVRGLGPDKTCDAPAQPEVQTLAAGRRFSSQGRVTLTPGRHRLTARYHVDAGKGHFAERGGEVGAWSGSVDSPEILVEVRP